MKKIQLYLNLKSDNCLIYVTVAKMKLINLLKQMNHIVKKEAVEAVEDMEDEEEGAEKEKKMQKDESNFNYFSSIDFVKQDILRANLSEVNFKLKLVIDFSYDMLYIK